MSAPPDMPMAQWSKPSLADLRRERRACTFDTWQMAEIIYGGKENFAIVERQSKLVASEPKLQADDLWWMSRSQRYYRACERARIFVKLVRDNRIPFEERGPLEVLLGEDLFVLLHDVMFLPSLINLADEEQQSWWLQKSLNYEYVGTYAQTELTHGSNVRGLGTQAIYDESLYNGDGGWKIHTPNLQAMKWWPGGLGKSCNCVILMAQVIIKGKNYGPHPFFFQVRDWNTHRTLPGIELRDIGQKLGYNGMDNGGMFISHAIIPRRNLLMKYVSVDKHGNYKKIGNQKMLFGTMTYTRLKISSSSGFNLMKAVVIATRYAAVRRQFAMQRVQIAGDLNDLDGGDLLTAGDKSTQDQLANLTKPSKKSECQIIDYVSQQYLLFPQMAIGFAMHFAGLYCQKKYEEAIVEFRANKFDKLAEMHVLTSTMKACNTMFCSDGMEQCRKSLGGHGYLNCAGIGPSMLSVLPQATYEGDFVVLSIQVGQQLLGAVTAKMMKGKTSNPNTPLLQYIYDFDPTGKKYGPAPTVKEIQEKKLFQNNDFLCSIIERRACFVIYSGAEQFQVEVQKSGGKIGPAALDGVKIEMMRMTYAHAYVVYAKVFAEKLMEVKEKYPKCYPILQKVFELFCLIVIDTGYDKGGGLGDFIAAQCLPAGDRKLGSYILNSTKKVLNQIRPQAVSLVDSWNIPDFLLNSCLGRFDGRVYEALYEQTKNEPLNETDVTDAYFDHLQFLIHPERETNPALVQKKEDMFDRTIKSVAKL